MKKRKKISLGLETKILFKNKYCCCICRNYQNSSEPIIHHIDGNPSNNTEGNLAVLCLNHASKADAGLIKGKLGSGKKLSPFLVKRFKQDWEEIVSRERSFQRENIGLAKKKQLELLYQFEINKRKNEILSFPKTLKKLQKSNFDFFNQLVIEEFISGIKLRKMLIKAYGDIAVQSAGEIHLSIPVAVSTRDLFVHLVGPKEVDLTPFDRQLLLQSLDIFDTLGDYGVWLNDDIKLLNKVCDIIIELCEVSSWYNFKAFMKKALKILGSFRKECNRSDIKNLKSKKRLIFNSISTIKKLIKSKK